MFLLKSLVDTVVVPPARFKDEEACVLEALREKYVNKVIPQVGLCVQIHQINDLSDGILYHSLGSAYIPVTFTVILMKPFVGEIFFAKIRESSVKGLRLSIGYFEDILVPPTEMPMTSSYDDRGVWSWHVEGEDGVDKYPLDIGKEVYVRVVGVQFSENKDQTYKPREPILQKNGLPIVEPMEIDMIMKQHQLTSTQYTVEESPMFILGSLQGDGLGLISWWL